MNARLCLAFGLFIAGSSTVCAQGQQSATATCGSQTTNDQCRVTWNFVRPSSAFYWVQQLDPLSGAWRSLDHNPDGTTAQGSRDAAVEASYLYRVLACDDANATINCEGSTMVWAPFIQAPEQAHLIPSRVPSTGPGGGYVGGINNNADWLTRVVQYNVYQFVNAIARANVAELPDMTPAPDIRVVPPANVKPIDQVQFNVYAVYLAQQGTPVDMPTPEPRPRGPHEHPERHPQ